VKRNNKNLLQPDFNIANDFSSEEPTQLWLESLEDDDEGLFQLEQCLIHHTKKKNHQ